MTAVTTNGGGSGGDGHALTKADFQSDQETRWCPGCGDYAVLSAVQQFMPELGIPPERIVFINSFSNQTGEITRHPIVPTWPRETRITVILREEPGGKTRLNIRWTPHNATEAPKSSKVRSKATRL